MSKKNNKKRKLQRMSRHHLFFPAFKWRKRRYAHALRSHPYCISRLQKKGLHDFIHKNIWNIPIPKEKDCAYIVECLNYAYYNNLIFDSDSIEEKITRINELIRKTGNLDTAKALSSQIEIAHSY